MEPVPQSPTACLSAVPERHESLVWRALAVGAFALTIVTATAFAAQARPAPEGFADLAEQVSPAVVNISVTQSAASAAGAIPQGRALPPLSPDHPFREFMERFFGEDFEGLRPTPRGEPRSRAPRGTAVGSGFIIDAEGYVVTNNHVIAQAEEIEVILSDGARFDAALIGRDERTDLALLKIEADEPLPVVAFGDSDRVRPGDWVMAVGNPFGLGGTVTAGIVSARGRDLPGGTLIDFLQIDAPINRGNSGGPTFNTEGDVIGVNTAIYSPTGGSVGIGFAIPSNLARQVVADLREHGKVERGWLGVRIQQVTPDIAEGFGLERAEGALVAAVEPNSPAAEAGFRAGDVILAWNGAKVEALKDLPRLVAATPVEQSVEVSLWRNGKAESFVVTTGSAPAAREVSGLQGPDSEVTEDSPNLSLGDTGLVVADLTEEAREAFGIAPQIEGVVVIEVAEGSVAQEQGLRKGDVIASLGLEPVTSTQEAARALEDVRAEGRKVVPVLAKRQGGDSFVALPIG